MSIDKKFLLIILVSIVLFVFAGYVLYLTNVTDARFFRAYLVCQLVCLIYTGLGFGFIGYAMKAPGGLFIVIVLGGIVARLFVVLVLIIISLKLLFVKEDIFIFSLFIFYNYFLILEIYYLIKKDGLKHK